MLCLRYIATCNSHFDFGIFVFGVTDTLRGVLVLERFRFDTLYRLDSLSASTLILPKSRADLNLYAVAIVYGVPARGVLKLLFVILWCEPAV